MIFGQCIKAIKEDEEEKQLTERTYRYSWTIDVNDLYGVRIWNVNTFERPKLR